MWYPIVNGLLMGALLGQLIWALRRWRLTSRREFALARVVVAFNARERRREAGVWEEEDDLAVASAMVALADEAHMQMKLPFLARVPHAGKQWPHFEPAPLLYEDADRKA